MLFQKTLTIDFKDNLSNINFYFEYEEGKEFGYFIGMKYGTIQFEQRLEKGTLFANIKRLETYTNINEGWDGDKFCSNPNYMTPEDLLMEEGDELDWNCKYSPCHY